ncbi:MAG: hypothetical protein C4582_02700 [Desulfobacteraceae bacterium]|nr:MAG: hypothetical protein C4582_02700 [Desulfobacteraceae bacterium]
MIREAGSSGVGQAVAAAERLDSILGKRIKKDPLLSSLLEEYRAAIARSRLAMEKSGMVGICASCALDEPGGCCFRDVEEWYDPVLLLVNRLLGVALPDRREVAGNCMFLGRRGCRIQARYHFCVNFLCPGIKETITGPMMEEVMRTSGEELLKGAELEYTLRIWVKQHGLAPDSGLPLA